MSAYTSRHFFSYFMDAATVDTKKESMPWVPEFRNSLQMCTFYTFWPFCLQLGKNATLRPEVDKFDTFIVL